MSLRAIENLTKKELQKIWSQGDDTYGIISRFNYDFVKYSKDGKVITIVDKANGNKYKISSDGELKSE